MVAIDYLEVRGDRWRRQLLELDFMDDGAPEKLKSLMRDRGADVVLSDMAAPTTGHAQTDHLRIMGLAEAAIEFACGRAGAGRRVSLQGVPGWHRGRSLEDA